MGSSEFLRHGEQMRPESEWLRPRQIGGHYATRVLELMSGGKGLDLGDVTRNKWVRHRKEKET